ncbi:6-bladed beta-propeller [Niabella pedocola]|uniref:6-bladed beta-propeller n=1 Tax=Niabella pedocola TaxID=1752077 RepID=A0ABS8PW42_9BACT|nr:6-bladed beta-propeller [Niabella pedocola]MCD2425029.1 6-bladed beta-propeller [Niabella pedocola]
MRHCLLLPLLLCLCYQIEAQPQKIYLNPKSPATENQSHFVDSLRFLTLEAKDGIIIGQWDNLEITASYFLITQYTNSAIFLYDRQGRFVKKISYKKLGDDFYPRYDKKTEELSFYGANKNYSLTPKDRIKIELNFSNRRNRKYYKKYIIDLKDPKLELKKTVPTEYDVNNMAPLYGDYYYRSKVATSKLYKDSTGYELKVYRNGKLVKQYFPYNQINAPKYLYDEGYIAAFESQDTGTRFITRPYCDTIYKITRDSLYPAFQMVMPLENALPSSFFNTPFKNKAEWDNFRQNNNWMFRQIYQFIETPAYYFFIAGFLYNSGVYMYDRKRQIAYQNSKIKADSTTFNINVLSGYNMLHKDRVFYKLLSPDAIRESYKPVTGKTPPEAIDAIINKKSNAAVIAVFTLKN